MGGGAGGALQDPNAAPRQASHAEMLRLVKESLSKAKARQGADMGGMQQHMMGQMPFGLMGGTGQQLPQSTMPQPNNQMHGAEAAPSGYNEPVPSAAAPKAEENGTSGQGIPEFGKGLGAVAAGALDDVIKHQQDHNQQHQQPTAPIAAMKGGAADSSTPKVDNNNGAGPLAEALARHLPNVGPAPVNTLDAMRAYLMQRKNMEQNHTTAQEDKPTSEAATGPPSVTARPLSEATPNPMPESTSAPAPTMPEAMT